MKLFWIALIFSLHLKAETINGYCRFPNAAQNYQSVYHNVIRFERSISLERAFQIADSDPSIEYFTYVTASEWKACVHSGPKYFTFHDPYRLIHCD